MRVLVTGGAGFIGSHVVDALLGEGHSVAVVDDFSAGISENIDRRARFYRASITDTESLKRVFAEERPQIVNHHSAQTDVRASMADPLSDARVNILGTVNLLQLSVEHDVNRFMFASTCAVYFEPSYMPMDESHPVKPQSGYGMSKHAAEGYITLYGDTYGLNFKIFRYGNVYGPRQNPKGEAGVVAIFAGQLLTGEQSTIFGDGKKTRDYIYVGDIARANLMAVDSQGDFNVFNLASGREVSDDEIFQAVRDAVGTTVSPVYSQKRPGEAERVSLDISKAQEVLGWKPTVSLSEGVRRTVAYYADQLGRSADG